MIYMYGAKENIQTSSKLSLKLCKDTNSGMDSLLTSENNVLHYFQEENIK